MSMFCSPLPFAMEPIFTVSVPVCAVGASEQPMIANSDSRRTSIFFIFLHAPVGDCGYVWDTLRAELPGVLSDVFSKVIATGRRGTSQHLIGFACPRTISFYEEIKYFLVFDGFIQRKMLLSGNIATFIESSRNEHFQMLDNLFPFGYILIRKNIHAP